MTAHAIRAFRNLGETTKTFHPHDIKAPIPSHTRSTFLFLLRLHARRVKYYEMNGGDANGPFCPGERAQVLTRPCRVDVPLLSTSLRRGSSHSDLENGKRVRGGGRVVLISRFYLAERYVDAYAGVYLYVYLNI